MKPDKRGALGGEQFVGTGGAATSSLAAASGAVPAASLTQPHPPDPFLLRLPASTFQCHTDVAPASDIHDTFCEDCGERTGGPDEGTRFCRECRPVSEQSKRDTKGDQDFDYMRGN